jgi:iron complex outermembrane receptor protein
MSIAIRTQVARAIALALSSSLLMSQGVLAAEEGGDLEVLTEVVVTAQFREQNLQDTPIAITAVNADLLEQRNQTSIVEVTAQAPNVSLAPQAQANGTGLLAFIRGVGQTDFNYALEPGVGMYIDDVYYATVTGSNFDLLDLDRVEVLRGPQGTLAGRNSIGGAIKLFSQRPTGDGSGSLSVTHGSYNRLDVRGSGDFALVEDKLFMRVAGASKSRNGYMKRMDYKCTHLDSDPDIAADAAGAKEFPSENVGTGCQLGTLGGISITAGRAALRWLASDSVEVNISGDVVNDTSEAGPSLLYRAENSKSDGVPLPSTDPRWVEQGGVPYDCRFVPYGPYSCDPNQPDDPYISYASFVDKRPGDVQRPFKPASVPPIQHLKQWGVSGTVDWEISDQYSLKWISSWREYDSSWAQDVDGSPLASQQLLQTLRHRQWTQEVRFNGALADGRVTYTLGGFYFDQDGTLEARVDLNYAGIDFIHGPDTTPATSKAVFGHLEFQATDAMSVVAGLRYTKDKKDYTYYRSNPDGSLPTACTGFPFGPPTNPNCVLVGLYDVSAPTFSSDRTDWRVGLNYRWNEALMTYAQVSTGYKGGGTNPRPFFLPQIQTFDPETLTTYELGAKTDLLDGRMRVNGALFFNKYKDIILTLRNCPGLGVPATPCQMPANVGKADVKGAELEVNLRLAGGFSVDASASLLDFEYTETDPASRVTLDMISPYTPEEKYSIGALWEGSMGDRGRVLARVDWSFTSEQHSEAINTFTSRVPGYGFANARVSWRNTDNTWEAALEVNNLTDRRYFIANQDWTASAGSMTMTPALPRTWAVSLKRNF